MALFKLRARGFAGVLLAAAIVSSAFSAAAKTDGHILHEGASICRNCSCCNMEFLLCPEAHTYACGIGSGCVVHGSTCTNQIPPE